MRVCPQARPEREEYESRDTLSYGRTNKPHAALPGQNTKGATRVQPQESRARSPCPQRQRVAPFRSCREVLQQSLHSIDCRPSRGQPGTALPYPSCPTLARETWIGQTNLRTCLDVPSVLHGCCLAIATEVVHIPRCPCATKKSSKSGQPGVEQKTSPAHARHACARTLTLPRVREQDCSVRRTTECIVVE